MKLKLFTTDATNSSEKDVNLPVFEGSKGLQAVKEVVVAHRANARLGTHSTKTRGEVRGGGKKPWNQKAPVALALVPAVPPLWGGGGVVFGPKPRDYSKKINNKVKALAFNRALFDRATAGEISIIETFAPEKAKTKFFDQIIGRIAPKGKVLVVDAPFTKEANLAARNIKRVTMQDASKLNTLDLVTYSWIVVSSKALEQIVARANGGQS